MTEREAAKQFHSVAITPARVTEEGDADTVRGLRVGSVFWHLLAAAKAQLGGDGISWYGLGLAEAEAALEAWERGDTHGFFSVWAERRKQGGRSGPSSTELEGRRMALLLCHALERTGFRREAARKFAARELDRAGVFANPITHRIIERWQRERPLCLTPQDELLLATGIATAGGQAPHRLARYFIGLAHLVSNVVPLVAIEIPDNLL